MRAAVVESASRPLVVADVPDPEPGPGELLLRVRSAGVCGTDLHLAGDPLVVPPGTVLGHEFAGEVAALGAGVSGWRIGERACALPVRGCGTCAACAEGDTMGCAAVRLLGAGDLPGAFAEYVRVGARESFRLPEQLDDDGGALVEPFAFALHAVRAAALEPNDGVLILGGGPVGLAIAAWAMVLGTPRVAVAESLPQRRTIAQGIGAATVDASDTAAVQGVPDLLGGPPSVVFECVGRPGMLGASLDRIARRGRIVVAGACMEADLLWPAVACLREADVRFVVSCSHQEFAVTLRMASAGRLPMRALVTDRVTLDELPGAFAALRAPDAQCKVILRP